MSAQPSPRPINDIASRVARHLLQGRPIVIRNAEYVMLDRVYLRAHVEGEDEARPLGNTSLEHLLIEAERHLSQEDVFILGAESVLEHETQRTRQDDRPEPMSMPRAIKALQDEMANHVDKVLRVTEVFDSTSGRMISLDKPEEVILKQGPGRIMTFSCNELYQFGASIQQVDSFWRAEFTDPQLSEAHGTIQIRGATVMPKEARVINADCRIIRDCQPQVEETSLSM